MKKLILLIVLFTLFNIGYGQNESLTHKGFFARVGMGPVFGHLDYVDKEKSTGNEIYKGEFKGTGFAFDMRLGGAIKENQMLTFDIISRGISSPQVSINGSDYTTNDKISISEVTYGVGYTYYVMPVNIYLSGTLGGGVIVLNNDGVITRSKFGLSTVLSAGKTWWIGKRGWGLGVNGSYGFTKTVTTTNDIEETIKSNRFFITGIVTFH